MGRHTQRRVRKLLILGRMVWLALLKLLWTSTNIWGSTVGRIIRLEWLKMRSMIFMKMVFKLVLYHCILLKTSNHSRNMQSVTKILLDITWVNKKTHLWNKANHSISFWSILKLSFSLEGTASCVLLLSKIMGIVPPCVTQFHCFKLKIRL